MQVGERNRIGRHSKNIERLFLGLANVDNDRCGQNANTNLIFANRLKNQHRWFRVDGALPHNTPEALFSPLPFFFCEHVQQDLLSVPPPHPCPQNTNTHAHTPPPPPPPPPSLLPPPTTTETVHRGASAVSCQGVIHSFIAAPMPHHSLTVQAQPQTTRSATSSRTTTAPTATQPHAARACDTCHSVALNGRRPLQPAELRTLRVPCNRHATHTHTPHTHVDTHTPLRLVHARRA